MKVLGQMIVRNEASRYLARTIPAILEVVDWLLVHDDGSTDQTVAVLRSFERVIVRRNGVSLWDRDGEGAARQRLLDETLRWRPAPDWVLSIDADELIAEPERLRKFLWLMQSTAVDVVSMTMREVWRREHPTLQGDLDVLRRPGGWAVRIDGGWAPRECPIIWRPPERRLTRIERWERGWTIPDRRFACGREPEIVRLLDAAASNVDLLHLGWSDPSKREERAYRYLQHDGGRYHDAEHLRSILQTPTLCPYPTPEGWR